MMLHIILFSCKLNRIEIRHWIKQGKAGTERRHVDSKLSKNPNDALGKECEKKKEGMVERNNAKAMIINANSLSSRNCRLRMI